MPLRSKAPLLAAVFNGDWNSTRYTYDSQWVWDGPQRVLRSDPVASASDQHWLQDELRARGARILHVSQLAWMSLPDQQSRDRFLRDQVFDRCPECDCFYMDTYQLQSESVIRAPLDESLKDAFVAGAAAGLNGRQQGVILGKGGNTITCESLTGIGDGLQGEYQAGVAASQAVAADVLIVSSERDKAICPKPLPDKMVVMPLIRYWTPSLGTLLKRWDTMERKFRAVDSELSSGNMTIIASGKSGRDFKTVIAAAKRFGSFVFLRLLTGGRFVDGCNAPQCRIEDSMPRTVYGDMLEDATLIAIPLLRDAKSGAGSTALIEAQARGKVVAITDRDGSLAEPWIRHGHTGFRLAVGDVDAWASVIAHMLAGGVKMQREYERRVFEFAQRRLSREAFADELRYDVANRCVAASAWRRRQEM